MRDFANYTEYLKDYLNNGKDLPVEFEGQIPPLNNKEFKQLFIDKYYMREIGSYTEEEFLQELQSRANVFIPFYKDIILKRNALLTILKANYVVVSVNELDATTTNQTTNLQYDTPTGLQSDTLPNGSISGGLKGDTTATSDNDSTTTTTYDENPRESIASKIKFIENEISNLYDKLLLLFEPCFIQIKGVL